MDLVAINAERTLFVSGEVDDWTLVKSEAIDTIVDMDGDVDPGLPEAPDEVLYVYFPIRDETVPSVPKLDAVGRMVASLLESGHRVLVHCRMGYNRSNLVIATALTYLGMSGEQALAHVQEVRPGALYNEAFAAHVRALPARRIRLETV